jgi:hypothetical protein
LTDMPGEPAAVGDVPLPAWSTLLLGVALAGIARRGGKR